MTRTRREWRSVVGGQAIGGRTDAGAVDGARPRTGRDDETGRAQAPGTAGAEDARGRGGFRVLALDLGRCGGRTAVEAMRECAPDLVHVSGAPQGLRWRSRCARLARLGGLVVIGGGRTAGGCLLLGSLAVHVRSVREGLLSAGSVDAAGLRGGLLAPIRGGGLVVAAVEVRGAEVVVAAAAQTAGSGDPGRRGAELARLRGALGGVATDRVVLAAELGDGPGGPSWSVLAGELRDARALAPTSSGAGARPRSAVFAGAGLAVEHYATRADDGAPVVVDLRAGSAGS